MRETIKAYKILVAKHEGEDYLGDLRAIGKFILKWILKKKSARVWNGLNGLRIKST
jgi:hypothetical protein